MRQDGDRVVQSRIVKFDSQQTPLYAAGAVVVVSATASALRRRVPPVMLH